MNKTETDALISDQEKLARLRLIRTEGIGPVIFRGLLAKFGNAVRALEGAVELSRTNGRRKPLSPPPLHVAERELEQVQRHGARALFLGQPDYPSRLAATEDAPPVLFILGNTDLLAQQAVGIVGARNASASGLKFTGQVAAKLSAAGVTIISGLARGIDTAAHRASLEGGTVACVAGGLDIYYPPENKALQQQIAEGGLLVSEMPLGTRPQARHFPRRNRLISGLPDGVLVVEAAIKSGSLITARFALEQGRDVFAVPGSPLDPRAKGGNKLLKDGAILVETADDILTELTPWQHERGEYNAPIRAARTTQLFSPDVATDTRSAPLTRQVEAAPEKSDLLSLLSDTPIHTDDVVRLSGATTEQVLAAFLELELAGKITRHAGGRVSRIYDE